MRGVSRWASCVAPLLAVFLVFGAAVARAGETQTPPTNPPEWRISPPGGLTAEWRISPPGGIAPPPPPDDTTTQARLQPPGGVTARVSLPVGTPLLDMLLFWLQSRLSVPHGSR